MLISWANFGFTSYWLSAARYLLPLFPLFMLLALWGERRTLHWALCFGFLMSYSFFVTLFVRGWWAF
jgi:hypothetical protein